MSAYNMKRRKLPLAVAVDFDGTICENAWPEIGEPNLELIEWLCWWRESGNRLILWTNRTGAKLDEAVTACKTWGLTFDAINANLPERIRFFGNDSRKVSADYYIDDKAAVVNGMSPKPYYL